jgi:hypothetical protein
VSAPLVLAVIAALAAWVGSLYLRPFGRCGKCSGTGTIKRTRAGKHGQQLVKVKVCPRCKGRLRVQRLGSRTVHRVVFRIRAGQRTAAKYREESHGDS